MYNHLFEQNYEMVSVSETHVYELVALTRIPATTMLNQWIAQSKDVQQGGKAVNLDRIVEAANDSSTLRSMLLGSEYFVNSYLFDQKAVDEWLRGKERPNKAQSVVEQIIETNFQQKNFLKKSDRFRLSLGMQSFQNYVPFNIPITDIFMRWVQQEGRSGEKQEQFETLFYVQNMELSYPTDMGIDGPSASLKEERQKQLLEQENLSLEFFKKMKTFVSPPDHHTKEHLKQ